MPNRILKESICTSDTIDGLSWFEEVFFYRLIVNCDDFGCMDARLPILRARLFPLKSVTDKQIKDALNKLRTVGIVTVYMYDGRPYLQLLSWERHQQVRAKRGKYPQPHEKDAEEISDNAYLEENDSEKHVDDSNGYHMLSHDIKCNQVKSDDCICPRNPIQSESVSESESEAELARDARVGNDAQQPKPKKAKTRISEKRNYAERVTMTDAEYRDLAARHGGEGVISRCIEILNGYKKQTGKEYASDAGAIDSWVIDRYAKEQARSVRESGRGGAAQTFSEAIEQAKKEGTL